MTEMITAQRFDRLEAKLDKLAEAMAVLARLEERQVSVQEALGRFGTRIDRHEQRIGLLESEDRVHGTKIEFGERIWWLVIGGGGSVLGYLSRGALGG